MTVIGRSVGTIVNRWPTRSAPQGRRCGPWPLAGIPPSADGGLGREGVSRRARRGCFARCGGRPGRCPWTPRFFEKNRVKLLFLRFLYCQNDKPGALQRPLQRTRHGAVYRTSFRKLGASRIRRSVRSAACSSRGRPGNRENSSPAAKVMPSKCHSS